MKRKLLLSFAAFSFCGLVFAQTIPNPSFENWTNAGSYEDPDGWLTFNFASQFGVPVTVTKSSDAFTGTSAIQLQTVEFTNPLTSQVDTLSGFVSTGSGDFMQETEKFGFSYADRPVSLTGNFEYSTPGASMGEAYVYFTKWDAVNGKRDTIGEGYLTFNPQASYTSFVVPIVYTLPDNPDTANIQFTSDASTVPPIPGSTLLIDNLAFELATGIKGISKETASVFPNPAINEITFKTVNKEAAYLNVYDVLGKEIISGKFVNEKVKLNVSDLPEGIYIYRTADQTGNIITTGKFSVIK